MFLQPGGSCSKWVCLRYILLIIHWVTGHGIQTQSYAGLTFAKVTDLSNTLSLGRNFKTVNSVHSPEFNNSSRFPVYKECTTSRRLHLCGNRRKCFISSPL